MEIRNLFEADEWDEILAAIPPPTEFIPTPSTAGYLSRMLRITTLPELMSFITYMTRQNDEDEIADWILGLCVNLWVSFSIAVLKCRRQPFVQKLTL